jgi:uncharacterized membrane protein
MYAITAMLIDVYKLILREILFMFCQKCGAQNPDNAMTCGQCGAPLGVNANMGAAPGNQQPYGYQQQPYGNQPPYGTQPGPGVGGQTSMQKNVAGVLCYLFGWITGIIFLVIEKDRFVRFHAWQSIFFSGALSILVILVSIISGAALGSFSWGLYRFMSVLSTILWIVQVGVMILCMVNAYQYKCFKLPVIGDIAEKQSAK